MNDKPDTPLLLSLVHDLFGPVALIGLVAYFVLLLFGPTTPVMAAIGVAYSGFFIRLVARWINRRDDPLSAGLPPDEP